MKNTANDSHSFYCNYHFFSHKNLFVCSFHKVSRKCININCISCYFNSLPSLEYIVLISLIFLLLLHPITPKIIIFFKFRFIELILYRGCIGQFIVIYNSGYFIYDSLVFYFCERWFFHITLLHFCIILLSQSEVFYYLFYVFHFVSLYNFLFKYFIAFGRFWFIIILDDLTLSSSNL